MEAAPFTARQTALDAIPTLPCPPPHPPPHCPAQHLPSLANSPMFDQPLAFEMNPAVPVVPVDKLQVELRMTCSYVQRD
jgi:hypothetical protein